MTMLPASGSPGCPACRWFEPDSTPSVLGFLRSLSSPTPLAEERTREKSNAYRLTVARPQAILKYYWREDFEIIGHRVTSPKHDTNGLLLKDDRPKVAFRESKRLS